MPVMRLVLQRILVWVVWWQRFPIRVLLRRGIRRCRAAWRQSGRGSSRAASASPSVFRDDGPGNADRAALLMTRAEAVQCFTSDRIPEPFQTEEYAAAWPFHRPPATYAGPKGPEIPCPRAGVGTKRWTPVLDEAVPGRTRGRPAMTADQLGHLLELSRTPHVEVRVLRLNTELALPVAFLAGHRLADQGTLWRQDGCTYTEADAHEKHGLMFGRPLRHAVGVKESRELIAKAREGRVSWRGP